MPPCCHTAVGVVVPPTFIGPVTAPVLTSSMVGVDQESVVDENVLV
jgi:hypothetical protein